MPKQKNMKKDELDRFYTKDIVAVECLKTLSNYTSIDDLYIEPSAGGGAFFRNSENDIIGIDLSPACDGVVQADWFDFETPDNCVVVGNPPFGTRNSLSKAFIIKACKSAKIVAFVLPASYRKETTQKVFSDNWALLESIDLPYNSFTFNSYDYHVPCVFQIWADKNKCDWTVDVRESRKVKSTTSDFEFTSKGESSHFIFGAAPSKIIEKELVKPNNRGYYIKTKSTSVIEKLKSSDWKRYANSTVNGGVAWYTKQEIINTYLI